VGLSAAARIDRSDTEQHPHAGDRANGNAKRMVDAETHERDDHPKIVRTIGCALT
jgi:hypothetical protein